MLELLALSTSNDLYVNDILSVYESGKRFTQSTDRNHFSAFLKEIIDVQLKLKDISNWLLS